MTCADEATGLKCSTLGELVDVASADARGIDLAAEALTDGTATLTWLQYADRVADMAGTLASAGVHRGDRVAVHLHKSVESFVTVHAVLRVGAVMVPLDPLAPPDLARNLLLDADVEVLVTDARPDVLAQCIDNSPVTRVLMPTVAEPNSPGVVGGVAMIGSDEIESAEDCGLRVVDPGAPAYIIYTSGSTGRPKGIVHSHGSALSYARTAAHVYALGQSDRLANVAALHFDQSTFELYAAAIVGAAVVTIPEPYLGFPASLSELIERERITVWYSVPYLLGQLSTRGAIDERDLSSLRWVLFGGEVFPPKQLAGLMRQIPGARFSNVYGPAEVNQCAIHNLSDPPAEDRAVPIGRAWPSAAIELVEKHDPAVPVPQGRPGLLLVRAPTMMTGYWNRPDLTAAAIVERPTDTGVIERWYRTGDLAVERDDGDFEFLGRVDNQIKLRGHRIELEALDRALSDSAGVRAATVVRDDGDDEDHLIALVVMDAPIAPGDTDAVTALSSRLLQDLRARVPRYAMPAEVRIVDLLPRTGTGKIDRIAARRLLDSHPPDSRPPGQSSTLDV